jgi:agmatinase
MPFDPDAPALEGSGIYGLPHTADEAEVILIPVPWEATTSYREGTAAGPFTIREASRQVDLFDVETGRPYERGIHMLEEDNAVRRMGLGARSAARQVLRASGMVDDADLAEALATTNGLGAELNEWVRRETERWLDRGKLVGVVGGDHSVSFGAIQALAARHRGLGILHVDAHADLRVAYEGFVWSHASIMYNVATRIPEVATIVQVGVRDVGAGEHAFIQDSGDRVITHFEPGLAALRFTGESWGDQCARIVAALPREVHISFDIDGLDPVYCPNTGTPVPGGLSFAQACFLLRVLAESGRRIVGFDLTEVAPSDPARDVPDPKDEWDGNVGARILYKMIGWALRTRSFG